ncbi:hypothetical protein [Alkalilacustris brevis]|uniref:hypothetical protein n=1 Tax=Alkalilacustris brevis TaxID=2026338 RepID=UPI0012D330C5|nr:hypothetical protein [Alkalilacustris brevis]
MKPAAVALCAGITTKRLHQLRDRAQLPYPNPGFRAELDISHAWRLRIQDAAINGPSGGIGPDDAAGMVSNAWGYLSTRYGTHPNDVVGLEVAAWIGAIEFAGTDRHGEVERWMGWFAGPVAELQDFIAAQLADPTSEALRNAHPVKVLALVNVTAAALTVLARADELGLDRGEAQS